MWSFGILLWELFSYGRSPYPRIVRKSIRIERKPCCWSLASRWSISEFERRISNGSTGRLSIGNWWNDPSNLAQWSRPTAIISSNSRTIEIVHRFILIYQISFHSIFIQRNLYIINPLVQNPLTNHFTESIEFHFRMIFLYRKPSHSFLFFSLYI